METLTTVEDLHLISEIQVSYRPKVMPSRRPKVTASKDAFEILKSTWDQDKILFVEEFKVLHLNRANRVIGLQLVSSGGIDSTLADARVILATALKTCATGLILAHNHPSCNLKPSESDMKLTEKLSAGARLLDLLVLDHLIITPTAYLSFADEGILPK